MAVNIPRIAATIHISFLLLLPAAAVRHDTLVALGPDGVARGVRDGGRDQRDRVGHWIYGASSAGSAPAGTRADQQLRDSIPRHRDQRDVVDVRGRARRGRARAGLLYLSFDGGSTWIGGLQVAISSRLRSR